MAEATASSKKKEVVKTPVTLSTGEVVEFGERQRIIKDSTLEDGNAVVTFKFRNGEVRAFSFDRHHPLLMRLAIHGALQKIGDEAARAGGDSDDEVAAIDSMITRLEAGTWGAERESGGFTGSGIVMRAIAEATGKAPADVAKWIEQKLESLKAAGTPTTRAALYQSFRAPGSKTAPIIARLEAEAATRRATKTPKHEANDLLADLIGGDDTEDGDAE